MCKHGGSKQGVFDGVDNTDAARITVLLTSNLQPLPGFVEGHFEHRPSPFLYALGDFVDLLVVSTAWKRVPSSRPSGK